MLIPKKWENHRKSNLDHGFRILIQSHVNERSKERHCYEVKLWKRSGNSRWGYDQLYKIPVSQCHRTYAGPKKTSWQYNRATLQPLEALQPHCILDCWPHPDFWLWHRWQQSSSCQVAWSHVEPSRKDRIGSWAPWERWTACDACKPAACIKR
jgi:hypothetical protein